MSSSGQANDLSMDEILASIRKIISEDPKPSPATQARVPAMEGMRGATLAARQAASMAPALPPSATDGGRPDDGRNVRTTRPALDEDILDLMDEDRNASQAAAEQPKAGAALVQQAGIAVQPQPVEQPVRAGLNDMWTPREWSKPVAVGVDPSPTQAPALSSGNVSTGNVSTANVSTAAEGPASIRPADARLEAAIAALGQSLAGPAHADGPAKPIVVAGPPKAQPHPGARIDVVAVVNAATRAALAQRSADEQMAAPVSAMPLASAGGSPEASVGRTETPSAHMTEAPAPLDLSAPEGAAVVTSAPASVAAPAVTPAVNAAVEAALAAARSAPLRSDVAKAPETPRLAEVPPSAPQKAVLESGAIRPVAAEHGPAAVPSKSIVAEPTQSASFSAQANAKVEGGNGVGGGFDAPAVQQASAPGVQTLEDTVARLLRPMLRQWLDDNMPRIVEKAFREELASQAAPPQPPRRAN